MSGARPGALPLDPVKGLCPLNPQLRHSLSNPFVGEVGREGDGRRDGCSPTDDRRSGCTHRGDRPPSRPTSPVKGSKGCALGGDPRGRAPWRGPGAEPLALLHSPDCLPRPRCSRPIARSAQPYTICPPTREALHAAGGRCAAASTSGTAGASSLAERRHQTFIIPSLPFCLTAPRFSKVLSIRCTLLLLRMRSPIASCRARVERGPSAKASRTACWHGLATRSLLRDLNRKPISRRIVLCAQYAAIRSSTRALPGDVRKRPIKAVADLPASVRRYDNRTRGSPGQGSTNPRARSRAISCPDIKPFAGRSIPASAAVISIVLASPSTARVSRIARRRSPKNFRKIRSCRLRAETGSRRMIEPPRGDAHVNLVTE